jgi:hypothetical protein
MRDALLNTLLSALLRLRWAYFHIHPGYKKFYMDSTRKEAHFFHARTSCIHSNYSLTKPKTGGDE